MRQEALWHDTPEDALKAIVDALGGPKKVGHALWPAKSIADAARYLNHCLDPERAEKMALGEILWLLQEGRKADCHTGMAFLARHCNYKDPEPIEPEDEKAALQRQVLEMGSTLQSALKRLEQLDSISLKAAS